MSEPQNWDVLARFLANEATPEEVIEVQAWIASDPENQVMVQKLRASFSVKPITDDASDLSVLWSKISQEIGRSKYGITQKSSRTTFLQWLRHSVGSRPVWVPATAMAAVLAIAWISYDYFLAPPTTLVEVEVPFGERLKVTLQDRTQVVLDAGSQLQYPEAFAENVRNVTLQGQGYFQVSKDASRPFVVTAGSGEVEVLGTAFDVQSWDNSLVSVSVEEGRVKFGRVRGGAGESVVLLADQVSTLEPSDGPTPPATIDIKRRLAWMRDEVFFDDAPLVEILDRLRRWHSVEFALSEPSILDERLTLHMTKADMQGTLDLLSRLLNLDVIHEGNSVRLTRRVVGAD